jgi:hypothetical protein
VSDFVDVGVLTLSVPPDAGPQTTELVIWGEGVGEEGRVLRRRALGPGLITSVQVGTGRSAAPTVRDQQEPFTAPWLGLDLPVMVTGKLPVRVVLEAPPTVQVVQGAEKIFRWRLDSEGSPAPLPELLFLEMPGMTEVRAEFFNEQGRSAGQFVGKPTFRAGEIRLRTTAGTFPGRFNLLVNADVKMGGETHKLYSPAIVVEVIHGYEIEMLAEAVSLAPGGRGVLRGRLSRAEGFEEPVDIRIENLPPGLSCAGVHVDRQEDRLEISCEALDSSLPGDYDVEIISSSVLPGYEKEKVPYSIPAVQARLMVRAEGQAASRDRKGEYR